MSSINVGDIVCFSCGLKSLTPQSSLAKWSAKPAKFLQINPTTGIAVAVAPGNVIVTYAVGNVALHSQSIVVQGIAKVQLEIFDDNKNNIFLMFKIDKTVYITMLSVVIICKDWVLQVIGTGLRHQQ